MLVIHGLSLSGKQTPQTSFLLYSQKHPHHNGLSTNIFEGLENFRFTIVSPEVNVHLVGHSSGEEGRDGRTLCKTQGGQRASPKAL